MTPKNMTPRAPDILSLKRQIVSLYEDGTPPMYIARAYVRGLRGLSFTWREIADNIGDVSPALCWDVADGADSAYLARRVMRKFGLRLTPYRTLAFRLSEEEFAKVRQIVDAHPGGRKEWLLEATKCAPATT